MRLRGGWAALALAPVLRRVDDREPTEPEEVSVLRLPMIEPRAFAIAGGLFLGAFFDIFRLVRKTRLEDDAEGSTKSLEAHGKDAFVVNDIPARSYASL